MTSDRGRRAVSEFVATAFLLIAVVGSGIMAERLSSDAGLQLLQNALATAGALAALIVAFGPVSGAHMNPAVTLTELALRTTDVLTAGAYVAAQVTGGVAGVVVANVMFDAPAVEWSSRDRSSTNLVIAEVVATIGLLLVIFLTVRRGHTASIPFAVAAYIGAAYYFTSSTSFANPAVTIARTASDTFAGIAPGSAPLFVAAQLVAVGVAVPLVRLLTPAGRTNESSAESP